MNCKKGDLAIIVNIANGSPIGAENHIGKIVRCIEFYYEDNEAIWETYPVFLDHDNDELDFSDNELRPIRDSDKEDEMLRLIGNPETNKLKV